MRPEAASTRREAKIWGDVGFCAEPEFNAKIPFDHNMAA